MLSSQGNESDYYWELERRIKQDKKYPGVMIEMRKSTSIWDIAMYDRDEVIIMGELEGFSEDLIKEAER